MSKNVIRDLRKQKRRKKLDSIRMEIDEITSRLDTKHDRSNTVSSYRKVSERKLSYS